MNYEEEESDVECEVEDEDEYEKVVEEYEERQYKRYPR